MVWVVVKLVLKQLIDVYFRKRTIIIYMIYQNVHIYSLDVCLGNFCAPVDCRNLVWHNTTTTNMSAMTTDTSRSWMTETSQLNWHIRSWTKNNFGVYLFDSLSSQYPFSHFILYGCWMLQITAEQKRRKLFVALKLACNLLSPRLHLWHTWQRQKTSELAVSLVRARSGQIPHKLSLSKDIENGPRWVCWK